MKTAQQFVFSEGILKDSLNAILGLYKKLSPEVYQNSIAFANSVADSINKWAAKDNYKETRKINRYSFIKSEGKWMPTPPGYMAAIEPYWNRMRTIALDSAAECKPVSPPAFNRQKETEFYKQAYEVYKTGNTLSKEQRDIAFFWDCNPFFLNTQGHLNFATKKLSPGGHWMSIVGIVARKKKCDLITSAAAYLLTSIALYDGFISCWDEKYRSNLVRPETYINAVIDESWRPLLQTPPFPEYPSGHSVISTAAAVVLTNFFGDNFSFDDDTETAYGLPVRPFSSFMDAANEAAISRMYGGIHYKAAIENGQQQGKMVGKKVLIKIRLTETN
jgi:membrane-associated phospholipid phosphatase